MRGKVLLFGRWYPSAVPFTLGSVGLTLREAFCYSVSIAPMIESIYFLGFLNTFSFYPKQVLVHLLLFPAQYVSRRGLRDLNMFFELQGLTQQCQFLIYPWKDMF